MVRRWLVMLSSNAWGSCYAMSDCKMGRAYVCVAVVISDEAFSASLGQMVSFCGFTLFIFLFFS